MPNENTSTLVATTHQGETCRPSRSGQPQPGPLNSLHTEGYTGNLSRISQELLDSFPLVV